MQLYCISKYLSSLVITSYKYQLIIVPYSKDTLLSYKIMITTVENQITKTIKLTHLFNSKYLTPTYSLAFPPIIAQGLLF